MFNTDGVILTTAGSELIARSIEISSPILFTSMVAGSGDIDNFTEAGNLQQVKVPFQTLTLSKMERTDNLVKIRGTFSNLSYFEEIKFKELGLYAKVSGGSEILFAYTNYGEGELIPPGISNNAATYTRDIFVGVTDDAEVFLTIDENKASVNWEEFDKFVKETEERLNSAEGKVDYASKSKHGIVRIGDGLDVRAGLLSHPAGSGSKHIPSGGKTKQFLKWSYDGTPIWSEVNYSDLAGTPPINDWKLLWSGNATGYVSHADVSSYTSLCFVFNFRGRIATIVSPRDVWTRYNQLTWTNRGGENADRDYDMILDRVSNVQTRIRLGDKGGVTPYLLGIYGMK